MPTVKVKTRNVTTLYARRSVELNDGTNIPCDVETEVTDEQLKTLQDLKGVTVDEVQKDAPEQPEQPKPGQPGKNPNQGVKPA